MTPGCDAAFARRVEQFALGEEALTSAELTCAPVPAGAARALLVTLNADSVSLRGRPLNFDLDGDLTLRDIEDSSAPQVAVLLCGVEVASMRLEDHRGWCLCPGMLSRRPGEELFEPIRLAGAAGSGWRTYITQLPVTERALVEQVAGRLHAMMTA